MVEGFLFVAIILLYFVQDELGRIRKILENKNVTD